MTYVSVSISKEKQYLKLYNYKQSGRVYWQLLMNLFISWYISQLKLTALVSFTITPGIFCLFVLFCLPITLGLPWWLRWQRICLKYRKPRLDPWRKIPWSRKWQPIPVFFVCFCATPFSEIPWTEEPGGPRFIGCKESDMTEQLTLSP